MNRRSDDLLSMPPERRLFRARLLERLRVVGITGAELARRAGLSKDAISTYTSMRSLPTPATLERLAKALDCKPADLLPVQAPTETVLELRDSPKPGHKVLVARIALPVMVALDQFAKLAKTERRLRAKRNP